MNPALAQKLAQEIGSLVVQCHALQADLDQARERIAELEARLPIPVETPTA